MTYTGSMRIISFCLFGNRKMYLDGALANAELSSYIYPGWECRFYVDESINKSICNKLSDTGAVVVPKQRKAEYDAMFWRFLPASDPNLDALIIRDTDSRIGEREALAVNEWLASGKGFHIMRDHPRHRMPILAGMWGVRGGRLPHIQRDIFLWRMLRNLVGRSAYDLKFMDQHFLTTWIYPLTLNDSFVHSEYIQYKGEYCRPFPIAAKNGEFIGQVIREEGKITWDMVEQRNNSSLITLSYRERYSLLSRVRHRFTFFNRK